VSGTVVIAIQEENARRLAEMLGADVLPYSQGVFAEAFRRYRRIVAVMAMGILVRGIAPLVKDKWEDPAVVLVTPDLRFAVPVLGGHHGANDLAKDLSGRGLTAVLSTATCAAGLECAESIAEANGAEVLNRPSTLPVNASILKGPVPLVKIEGPAMALIGPGVSVLMRKGEFIVGVGCNRGVSREEVVTAVETALSQAGIGKEQVLAYASTDKKSDEAGLIQAVASLGGSVVFVGDEDINSQDAPSPSRARERLGIKGVAEPSALALSRKKELIMRKKVFGNVTVAIAR